MAEILVVTLIAVGFAFKTDGAVGLHPVAQPEQMVGKLQHIDHEETHKKPLALLAEVDQFVAHVGTADTHVTAEDDDAAEGDAAEWSRWKTLHTEHNGILHAYAFARYLQGFHILLSMMFRHVSCLLFACYYLY